MGRGLNSLNRRRRSKVLSVRVGTGAPLGCDRYLVTSVNDYGHGLGTLTLTRDGASGKITGAKLVAISMSSRSI